jgi:hypothetical protein
LKLVFVVAALAILSFGSNAQGIFIRSAAERSGLKEKDFNRRVCDTANDAVAARVFKEYGAVFIATENVLVPAKCVFDSSASVNDFQARTKISAQRIGNAEIELQAGAMDALNAAIAEAASKKVRITPLDGSIAGLRSYEDTVRLWNSRFNRALNYWQGRGRISKVDADAARASTTFEQVPIVLKWEQNGMWFSTGFSRSILTSVAAPGTSQHLSGLAFDVVEYRNATVRSVLNKHGWFQTVASDEPHFTYLGRTESELPKFGLISTYKNGYKFWVPAIQ